MSTWDLLNKSDALTSEWIEKESILEDYIDRWLKGEVQKTDVEIQDLYDRATEQIDQLKAEARKAQEEYIKAVKEEAMRKSALISVKHNFGVSPDEFVITGGVLSSNAEESHLIGRQKSHAELALEREQLLGEIRSRVMRKEMSLADASKLANDVNIAYGINMEQIQENTEGVMKR